MRAQNCVTRKEQERCCIGGTAARAPQDALQRIEVHVHARAAPATPREDEDRSADGACDTRACLCDCLFLSSFITHRRCGPSTLRTKSGTCRDYAWLMIEALRRLGFVSRFASSYLYDGALDGGAVGVTGSGATHAWLQVFLPGATVAVVRHPGQAVPLEGSWCGEAKDYLGMSIDVSVHKVGEIIDPSEGRRPRPRPPQEDCFGGDFKVEFAACATQCLRDPTWLSFEYRKTSDCRKSISRLSAADSLQCASCRHWGVPEGPGNT